MEKQGTSEWKTWAWSPPMSVQHLWRGAVFPWTPRSAESDFPSLLSFANRTQEHDFITRQTRNGSPAEQIQRQQQPLVPSLNPAPLW
ncbi:hypothetical protein QQF64_010509 [Cirrhinus molitorella]|uniref:Uncharacterized protein n=1 Tax=Cirrhinus molitorella TaxID=172907 RepID=A0ABR3M7U7_9TELE